MAKRAVPVARVARGAGGKPQLRDAVAKGRWTAANKAAFLAHLTVSCNVAASCRKSGLSDTLVYRKRKSDAEFRASWARAIAEAVERLELMLLERAMNGKVVEKRRSSGETIKTVEYPDQIAMALIRAHKDNAAPDEPDDEETLAALRAKISRKLDIVARREAAKEAKEAVGAKYSVGAKDSGAAANTGEAGGAASVAVRGRRAGGSRRRRDAKGRFVRVGRGR